MSPEICIIHSSTIIQHGLETILNSICSHKITIIKYPSDLQALKHAKNTKFIVFTETKLSPEYNQAFHNLKKQSNISIVNIIDEDEPKGSEEFVITHYSKIEDIAKIIEKIEESENPIVTNNDENENLSTREKEVLKYVALGFSNKEIAEQLFISIHTVISHRKNIVEKTGIKSVSGLTMYAIMTKIIDPTTIDISKLI